MSEILDIRNKEYFAGILNILNFDQNCSTLKIQSQSTTFSVKQPVSPILANFIFEISKLPGSLA